MAKKKLKLPKPTKHMHRGQSLGFGKDQSRAAKRPVKQEAKT